MDFKEYIKEIDRLYSVGNTTEHSFRGSLQSYLSSLLSGYIVTNEPRRRDCGAPDYVITQNGLPVAFFEAKDIDDGDLDGRRQHKKQFDRYKASLDGIIFTDYLDFHLYQNGEFVDSVRIAETRGNHIVELPENRDKFEAMVSHLVTKGRQRITSSSVLARLMAGKAHLLAEVVNKTIVLEGEDSSNEIATQLRAFRDVLIHDLKSEEFADIYAQTIVYGMFTARLYDSTPENFSRQEAAELIPRSNPFLRKIFQSIAVYDLDDSIAWIVDDIAAMFQYTDAEKIMKNYGSNKRHSDPIVHFYEDFLAEYDPKLRKARGVWYTPAPVVKFIVRSVDEILQQEFGLARGLADDSKVLMDVSWEQSRDKRFKDGIKHEKIEVPRVQILDPATGTGTFLAEVIELIRDKFNGLEGLWTSYVEKSLIPRIHGFEILMASYTIAHLKLAITLKNTGYSGQMNQRLNVFLTNSLEEATPRATTLFAKWLSDEADAASKIKNETPVMICLGNPPYNNSSMNQSPWILDKIRVYKEGLNEKKLNLDDDYVKFIRLAQNYIDKNNQGIIGYITNNNYIDAVTFRQMRYALLNSFDDIYILNLHGSFKKKEVSPDGSPDENVFDIQQGTSIVLMVKKASTKKGAHPGNVYYAELYGLRDNKYAFLESHSWENLNWQRVNCSEPYYFFVPKDERAKEEYEKGASLNLLMPIFVSGFQTKRDALTIHFNENELLTVVDDFKNMDEPHLRTKYSAVKDGRDWTLALAKADLAGNEGRVEKVSYRPFDDRYTFYSGKSKGFIAYPRKEMQRNLIDGNISIITCRQQSSFPFQHVYATKLISDMCSISSQTKETSYIFPLLVKVDNIDGSYEMVPNFSKELIESFERELQKTIVPQELFDYIYAVLHSPKYRETYKEFLKIDFPRIPYPKNAEQFHRLAEKGAELRRLHLMEGADNWATKVTFPVNGDNIVDKPEFQDGKVYINKDQYFGNVSELAWNFYIGGYQPAQKWLKDRKNRTLDYEDILHYGRIIYALQETDRLMKEIDEIGVVDK